MANGSVLLKIQPSYMHLLSHPTHVEIVMQFMVMKVIVNTYIILIMIVVIVIMTMFLDQIVHILREEPSRYGEPPMRNPRAPSNGAILFLIGHEEDRAK